MGGLKELFWNINGLKKLLQWNQNKGGKCTIINHKGGEYCEVKHEGRSLKLSQNVMLIRDLLNHIKRGKCNNKTTSTQWPSNPQKRKGTDRL